MPSRDASPEKTERKRKWLTSCEAALAGTHGLADAFRHLRPESAEYSWVGRTGDGYRYDYASCSRDLAGFVTSCDYLHQPRTDKLFDHSALTLHPDRAAPQAPGVGDPAAADEARDALLTARAQPGEVIGCPSRPSPGNGKITPGASDCAARTAAARLAPAVSGEAA